MFTIPLPWPDASLLVSPPFASLPALLRGLVLAFLVVSPLVLLIVLYRYELRLVTRGTALALFSLRTIVLLLTICLVCLQPILAHDRSEELPGTVLVAIDQSRSMSITDPQRSGEEKLRLARTLGLVKNRVSEELFTRWLNDHERKQDPAMLLPGEASGDNQQRQQLRQERQRIHDELLAEIDGITREQLARKILDSDGLKLLDRIRSKHEVELVGFARTTWDLDSREMQTLPEDVTPDTINFSDLHNPLSTVLERSGVRKGKVVGVVMLTDGQHNFGPSPATRARELGSRKIPVYPVAIGSRTGPPDAAIVSIRGPEYTVFKDVEAVIEVKTRIQGLSAQEFILELHREGKDGKMLASRSIQHDGRDRTYTEQFPVKMDTPGIQSLVAKIRPAAKGTKELSDLNNQQTTTISVADDRAKVLIVDGEARWEYHYLHSALSRDRLVDLKSIVFDQPRLDQRLTDEEREAQGLPSQSWPAEADTLSSYQCIILGDVDPANLSLSQRQALERYVADSAGTLIILAGKRAMPLAYPEAMPTGESDPLTRLLPIELPRKLAPPEGFPMSLTTAGRETRYMELDTNLQENDALWAGFPRPWMWAVSGKAKPGATALVSWLSPDLEALPLSDREKQHTIVARHNYGFGRVLYIGFDSTWRWRFKVGDIYHHRFWGQITRWAAADRPLVVGNKFVRFGTPQPVYRPGEPVEVVVRLADALGKLRTDLAAGARILRLDEKAAEGTPVALIPLERRPGQPRVFESKLRDLPPGKYAVELAIPEYKEKLLGPSAEGEAAKPLRSSFTILTPESKEMIALEVNEPLLSDLATSSGGRVFTAETIAELEDLLLKRGIPTVEHREQKLWQWWGFLAVVVTLLTVEWVMRKMAGLP